jgi:hypothetical protein
VGGHYGVGLYNNRDAVVAGWAFEPVSFEPGYHILEITIPQLPLQPGTYQVSFALFTGGNNLTGGLIVDKWFGNPPLTLDVPPLAHAQDEWAGVLNVPATFAARNERTAPALALSS